MPRLRGQPGPGLEVSCNGIGGAYSGDTPCPSDQRVGRCTLAPVLGVSAVYNYYSPTWDEAGAQMDCDGFQDGSFEPG